MTAIWRQDCHALPTETEPFGYRDGISHPAVEGSGIPGSNPLEEPLKAGEFVLGYPDELGGVQTTTPEVLGRNGSYVAFRKLHQHVARSARVPEGQRHRPRRRGTAGREDHGTLAQRRTAGAEPGPRRSRPRRRPVPQQRFLYQHDDPAGFTTPGGCHIRRGNPRDAAVAGVPRLHRMIRRGTAYGPPLPEGVLDDDGADRGLMFAFVGAHLGRQFRHPRCVRRHGGQ